MWDGAALPHSEHTLSLRARQRWPVRRRRFFILDVRRFGTAIAREIWLERALKRQFRESQRGNALEIPQFLQALFFDIIHVEPVVDNPSFGKVLRNVSLEELLQLNRHFADSLEPEVIVPLDDLALFRNIRIFLQPACHFLVRGPRRDLFPEPVRGDAGEFEEEIVERAVEMVFAERSRDFRPAFVEGSRGNNVASQGDTGLRG